MDDTPAQKVPTSGCPPDNTQDTCPKDPGFDPIHNFMDYSYDQCYTELTQGQAAVARLLARIPCLDVLGTSKGRPRIAASLSSSRPYRTSPFLPTGGVRDSKWGRDPPGSGYGRGCRRGSSASIVPAAWQDACRVESVMAPRAAPYKRRHRVLRPDLPDSVRQVSTVADVVAALDGLYDPARAEAWDAVGLVCGDPGAEVRRVLLPSIR